jgi:DDE superfamily endonuclease
MMDSLLSAKRDAAAAERFLTKALGGENHPAPRVINTDKHAGYPPAIVELKIEGVLEEKCRHRPVKYLNNLLEQDHRASKRGCAPLQRLGCDSEAGKGGGFSHSSRMSHLAGNRHYDLPGERMEPFCGDMQKSQFRITKFIFDSYSQSSLPGLQRFLRMIVAEGELTSGRPVAVYDLSKCSSVYELKAENRLPVHELSTVNGPSPR